MVTVRVTFVVIQFGINIYEYDVFNKKYTHLFVLTSKGNLSPYLFI